MDSARRAMWHGYLGFLSQGFHRVVATTPVSSETDKQDGGQVPTMVLFETRGL